MTTDGRCIFPTDDDASLKISLALLGTVLATLKHHSPIMAPDRAKAVEALCKTSIREQYNLAHRDAETLNHSLDSYQSLFVSAMREDKNPFGEVSGIMLLSVLGSRFDELCLPSHSVLNPAVHSTVGGLVTISVKDLLAFWKDQ